MAAISGREVQPNFERLCHDCLEEEGRIQRRASGVKEWNLALASKTKKFNKSFHPNKKEKKPQSKHLDVFKIECLIVTRWDTMLEIVSSQRKNSKEDSKHPQQKKNQRGRRILSPPQKKNQEENTT